MSRDNQRRRTRKDLLEAAARLIREGRTPTLDEVAEAALVSRATAYRYFPGLDALLLEASLDVEVPDAETVFAAGGPEGLEQRLLAVDTALHAMIAANEPALRAMLVHALQQRPTGDVPARQNRRTPLIQAATAPFRNTMDPRDADMLEKAMALIVGTEAVLVFKDVLRIDDDEAARVRAWAIRALARAAQS